jgi:hypothetical protein
MTESSVERVIGKGNLIDAGNLKAYVVDLLLGSRAWATSIWPGSISIPTTCPGATAWARPIVIVPGPHPQSSTLMPGCK